MNKIRKMQMQRAIRQDQECPECPECGCHLHFNSCFRLVFILLSLVLIAQQGYAQSVTTPFQDGEELHYDIHYKYGLMLKAGTINYYIHESLHGEHPAYHSTLNFKTTFFFDKIFKIRDTLDSYISRPNFVPIYHHRSVNEGNAHFKEELFVQQHGLTFSEMRSIQKKGDIVLFDTILSANNLAYDILNIFMFVRTLDYSDMKVNDAFPLSIFMGKEKANIIIRYLGQTVVEMSSTLKYKAVKLNIDVADKAFNQTKNSLEVWIGDDENKVPIKLKAKLKIGTAEAHLSSYKNIKHPFNAEINRKINKIAD